MKLLIVDDSLFMRHFIRTALAGLNIDLVIEAADGNEAIRMFAMYKPDLVLMDINMPFLDGVSALREIKRIDPNARIVMISSTRNQRLVDQIKQLGASAYIQKPFPKMQIEDIVSDYCH